MKARLNPNSLAGTLLALAAPLLAAAPSWAQEKAEKKDPKPVLYQLTLKGPYMDLPEHSLDLSSLLGGGMGGTPKPFFQLLERLDEVKGAENHLLVDLSPPELGLNLAQLTELERRFTALRERGVKTTAWLTSGGIAHFQVACMCDRIYLADMGVLEIGAPAMQTMFYKDLFDLVGLQSKAVRCGEFKGAVEPFMRSTMSRHLREHYRKMLASFNEELVGRIAKARGLSRKKVRELQAKRLFMAPQAKAAGLVDETTHFSNARDSFRLLHPAEMTVKHIKLSNKKIDLSNPFTLLAQLFGKKKEKKIRKESVIVLHLSGTIVDGEKDKAGSIVSGPTARRIDELAGEEKVKAVVLRINSPGGSASASERILLALRRLARRKPVTVSMGRMAASGGYYISCLPGSSVYAEPATLTGSIGVFGLLMNYEPLARRVGLRMETVGLDPSADWGNPFSNFSEEFLAWLQKSVDTTYDRFLSHVTLARRMPRSELLPLAGGRVWSGAQAMKAGLVDKLGGLHQAVAEAAGKAGLEKGEYEIKHLPAPRNPLSLLASGLQAKGLRERLPAALGLLPEKVRSMAAPAVQMILASLEGRQAGRVWAMLPLGVQIR